MKISATYETSDGRKFGSDREAAEKHQAVLDDIEAFCDRHDVPGRGRAAKRNTILSWIAYTNGAADEQP